MTIVNTLPFDLQNGTTADASQVMADFNGIVDDVNNNAAHNGANNDITSLSGLTTPITPAQGGTTSFIGGTSGGSANAQTLATPSPTGFGYTDGYRLTFTAGFTNTGATTLNVDSLGNANVFKPSTSGPIALTGGEIVAANKVDVIYDGTRFILMDDVQKYITGVQTNVFSSTTTDLGAQPSHMIGISLSASPVTSFGSSANVAYPVYFLQFGGVITLTHNASTMILPGNADIVTANGDFAIVKLITGSSWRMLAYYRQTGVPINFNAAFLRGYIDGLTLSAAGSTGTFGIAAGIAADSTNVSMMALNSAYTKTTASWAVGTGNGGLDTGAIATGTWYHVHEIQRVDTGVVDVLFSLSATAPTLPANYTLFRRIGSMKTDGSSQWLAFTQTGGYFIWSAHITDAITATTSRSTHTLTSVPTGVVVQLLARVVSAAGGTQSIVIVSLQEADYSPGGAAPDVDMSQNTAGNTVLMNVQRFTNTSAQVGSRATNTGVAVNINGYGWIDARGKS